MDEKDQKELAETLSKVLDDHRGVDSETHKKHHEFIEGEIQARVENRMFWAGIRKQVFGWGIIVILSGIGYAVADYVKHLAHIK